MTKSSVKRFWKPRCIHLHHIRGYDGLLQKIMYVIRRLLGMDTPTADLIGCPHLWKGWKSLTTVDEELSKLVFGIGSGTIYFTDKDGVEHPVDLMDVSSLYPAVDYGENIVWPSGSFGFNYVDDAIAEFDKTDPITTDGEMTFTAELTRPEPLLTEAEWDMIGLKPVDVVVCDAPNCPICKFGEYDMWPRYMLFEFNDGTTNGPEVVTDYVSEKDMWVYYGIDVDTDMIQCKQDGCTNTVKDDRWGKIKAGAWFFSRDGDAWCPDHLPNWVTEWRKRNTLREASHDGRDGETPAQST